METNVAPRSGQNQEEHFDCTMKFKVKKRLRLELETDPRDSHKPAVIATATDDSAFTRMISDRYPESFPAHKIPAWTQEMGPGFMEWLAMQCGGAYHHREEVRFLKATPLALVGMLANLAGKTVQQIVQDFQDNVWTREERQADLPNLRKLRSVVDTLIHDAEGTKP